MIQGKTMMTMIIIITICIILHLGYEPGDDQDDYEDHGHNDNHDDHGDKDHHDDHDNLDG